MHGVTSKVSNIIPRPSPFTTSSILFLAERFTSTSPSPQVAASRLKKALQKLEAVEHTVYVVKQELGTLQVKLAAAEQEVQQRMTLITAAKEKCVCIVYLSCSACLYLYYSILFVPGRYMAASRQCKFAEETIETETRNVEQLNATVEEKFSEVGAIQSP